MKIIKKNINGALKKVNFSALGAKLSPNRKMLALEMAGEQLLGAVVSGRGGRFTVNDFVALERNNPGDDLPDPANVREIMERLDYQTGPVVLVTPLARTVQISINRAKVEKLKNYQLIESVRWEVEPYTGISGAQAMVGVEKSAVADQDMLLAMEEDDEVEVNVSAIEQNVFRALKQLLKKAGLKLIRIYPPDVCFYMTLFISGRVESEQAVLDIGSDYSSYAIVKGRRPQQINTYPLGRETIRDLIKGEDQPDILDSLRFILRQSPGPLPLVLTGSGAIDPEVIRYIDEMSEYGAAPLVIERASTLTEPAHQGLNAVYATVTGAAARELLGGDSRLIGVTDAVALVPRLKKSAYILPLAVTVLLALSLFAHYGFMKIQKKRHKIQTKELAAKLKVKQARHNAFDQAEKNLISLQQEISLTKRKIAFVQGGADDNLSRLDQVLASLAELPDEMTLESIKQEGKNYLLTGSTGTVEVVGDYSVRLQDHNWCRAVALKSIESSGDGLLHFKIEINITTGAGPA